MEKFSKMKIVLKKKVTLIDVKKNVKDVYVDMESRYILLIFINKMFNNISVYIKNKIEKKKKKKKYFLKIKFN